MSLWIERVNTHPLWQNLETLGPVIDQALARDGVDASTLDGLARLKSVLAFVGKRLEGSDPYLLTLGSLDSLSTAIQNSTSEVQAFISNGNPGHITNANTHGDSALVYLGQLNVPIVTTDLVALRDAANSYRTAVERNVAALDGTFAQTRNDLEGLRNRLSEITVEVTAEKQRLSTLASEHQSQFSTAQESRSKDYADAQASRQEKFTALVSDYV